MLPMKRSVCLYDWLRDVYKSRCCIQSSDDDDDDADDEEDDDDVSVDDDSLKDTRDHTR